MSEEKTLMEATCPSCRGPLSEFRYGAASEYQCLIGHRYSPRALLKTHAEAEEKALWVAVLALEESANLANRVAAQFDEDARTRIRVRADKRVEQAAVIRSFISSLEPFELE